MPEPIQTDLGSILLAVKQRLISTGVFSPTAVYLGLSSEVQVPIPPPADQFCVIIPSEQIADQGVMTGGGNLTLWFDGEIQACLFSRLYTDETPRSENWLTDPALGALSRWREIVSVLNMWQPIDVNGFGLVYTPFKVIKTGKVQRVKEVPPAPGWGVMATTFKFKWMFQFSS